MWVRATQVRGSSRHWIGEHPVLGQFWEIGASPERPQDPAQFVASTLKSKFDIGRIDQTARAAQKSV